MLHLVTMKKKDALGLATISFISVIVISYMFFDVITNKKIDDTKTATIKEPKTTYINASTSLIQVTSPLAGAIIAKEFTVSGKARGYWYFEGTFPAQLQTPGGSLLAEGVLTGQGNWMTEEFVPFHGEFRVSKKYTGKVVLIIKNDNPSGLSEKESWLSIPLYIK